MMMLWLQFVLCAVLIGRAGFMLSLSADRIARATGLTGGWIGLALLATVTSLPELASGISSVTWIAAPNLAVGNALGACLFNLLFLVVIDALQPRQPIYLHASPTHLLSAAFGVVMLGFVAMSLLMAGRAPALLHFGLYSPALLALYLLALRSVYDHERSHQRADCNGEAADQTVSLRAEWVRFGLAAAVVLAAGSWLPSIADGLAQLLGWNRSFVGTLFMALVTTLPEMAVTLSALRLRALDMAIGNLLGSNLFNATILVVDDAFYTRGPLLADASPVHAVTAVAAAGDERTRDDRPGDASAGARAARDELGQHRAAEHLPVERLAGLSAGELSPAQLPRGRVLHVGDGGHPGEDYATPTVSLKEQTMHRLTIPCNECTPVCARLEQHGYRVADCEPDAAGDGGCETRRAWLADSPRADLRATVYRMDALRRLIDLDQWGLALPLVVRGREISAAALAAAPPGCYDGPQPGARAIALQQPLARGLDVRLVQLGLSDCGMDIRADGVYGPGSSRTVKAFQVARGLPVTGVADIALISSLVDAQ